MLQVNGISLHVEDHGSLGKREERAKVMSVGASAEGIFIAEKSRRLDRLGRRSTLRAN